MVVFRAAAPGFAWSAACWLTRLLAVAGPRPAGGQAGPIDWGGLAPPTLDELGPWARPEVLATGPVKGGDGRWRFGVTWAPPSADGPPAGEVPALICHGEADGDCLDGSLDAGLLQPFPAAIAPSPSRPDTLVGFAHMVLNLARHGRRARGRAAAPLVEAALDQVPGSEALTTLARGLEHLDMAQSAPLAAAVWFRLSAGDPDPGATWFAANSVYQALVGAEALVHAHLLRLADCRHHRFVLTPACAPIEAVWGGHGARLAGELMLAGNNGGQRCGEAWATAHNARGLASCAPPGSLPAGDSSLAVGVVAQLVGLADEVEVGQLPGWRDEPALAELGGLTLAEAVSDAAATWFEGRDTSGRRRPWPWPPAARPWGRGLESTAAARLWGARLCGLVVAIDAGLWRAPAGGQGAADAAHPTAIFAALGRRARGGPAAANAWPLPLANPRRLGLASCGWMDDALRLPSGEIWRPRTARLPPAAAAGGDGAAAATAALCRRGFNNLWLPLPAAPEGHDAVVASAAEAAAGVRRHFGTYITLAPTGGDPAACLALAERLALHLGDAAHVLLQPWGQPPAVNRGDDGQALARRRLRAAGYRQPLMALDPARLPTVGPPQRLSSM